MPSFSEWSLQALRHRAEAAAGTDLAHAAGGLEDLSVEALHRMVHELQVHQIELEMQNDQLRHTQQELDAARARYFDLYDLAPVGYCTVDAQGLILEANFTAALLLDTVRSDLVQQPVSRFIVKSDQDTYYRCRKALLVDGLPQECELQMLKRGGAPIWVHMRLSAAQDSAGAPVQRMVLGDISERRRMDGALQTQNRELETARAVADKANLAKSDFLSNMTHELRSPLNAILGFAQLIDQGVPAPTANQKSSVDQILKAGWYLLDLIGEILDLAAIESGKVKLTLEPVALAGVLLDCHSLMEPQAAKKGVALHFTTLAQPYWVVADSTRLKQVMVNLLSNAIKYNRIGGRVDVHCEQKSLERLRISVQDTGIGLSPSGISRLFQPFNRLGHDTRTVEGSGIGLAVSKRLVELIGGTIGVDSTVGVGSVFWFELDLLPDADMPENTAANNPRPPLQGETP
ncbi:MAG: PAS domain-containing sensor histidine kinase [Rhodoferax sp.]|nr:PAS domain-containing sensor histidine kinase [Rhodoferax sp.]